VGTIQDVTEQRAAQEQSRKTEEQLRQAQKMEAVGRLAGGVAHDFNNLLGVITGYAQMLGRELGEAHPGHKRLAQIERAAARASELTRRLLAFSRAQPAEPRPIDLAALVADMEPMLRRMIGEDVSLVVASEAHIWSVRADPGQIEQAIMNLVVNARDAMPRGGRITITTRNLDSGPHDDKPAIELQVSDTGEGMSPEVRARVFEPFFTTKESGKGTGLGLPMAYAAVGQAGGSMEVTSEPGAGATFRILLPRCESPASVLAAPASALETAGGHETILLVEDDPALREMVREILEASGYRVLEADGPAQADARSAAEASAIDLVLSDVVLPEGGGQQVLDALRQRRPAIRALFMSGYCDETLGPRGVAAGSRILSKPFSTQTLLRAVRESLQADPG
jgi:CheY-like chemotaxis protein